MEFHFHPALALEEELYGDAVLSRFPLKLVHAGPLPGLLSRPRARAAARAACGWRSTSTASGCN